MNQFRFKSPNYTQAPNDFFDDLLKEIDDLSELKVTLAAIRMTIGYHREQAELSQEYLISMTGLSKNSVRRGLALSLRRGTIVIKVKPTNRIGGIYALSVGSGGSANDTLEGQPMTPLNKGKKEIYTDENPIFTQDDFNKANTPKEKRTVANIKKGVENAVIGFAKSGGKNRGISDPNIAKNERVEFVLRLLVGLMGYETPSVRKEAKNISDKEYGGEWIERQIESLSKTNEFKKTDASVFWVHGKLEDAWAKKSSQEEKVWEFSN